MTDAINTESTDTNNDAVLEQTPAEQINEHSAAAMAAELKDFDEEQELDFDPMAAMDAMPEEVQQAALNQVKDVLISEEGAKGAACDGMDMLESLLQDHAHPKFVMGDTKKAQGAKRLTPIIQKYAPAALEMFGNYKDEVLAALFFGSFTFSAVKQIKALKAEDAKAKTQADPEQAEAELDAHAAH